MREGLPPGLRPMDRGTPILSPGAYFATNPLDMAKTPHCVCYQTVLGQTVI